jgi:hypothetical protein
LNSQKVQIKKTHKKKPHKKTHTHKTSKRPKTGVNSDVPLIAPVVLLLLNQHTLHTKNVEENNYVLKG